MSTSKATAVAVMSLLICSVVCAAPTEIGNSKILIPDQDGFVQLTGESSLFHPIGTAALEECDATLCAIYVGNRTTDTRELVTWESVPPFYQVMVLDDAFVLSIEQFQDLKRAMKADLDGLRRMLTDGLAATSFDPSVFTEGGEVLVFEGAPTEILDTIYEEESYLSLVAKARNDYRRSDGSRQSYAFSTILGVLHAQDKVLLVLILAPDGDIDWAQSTFDSLANDIVELNHLRNH